LVLFITRPNPPMQDPHPADDVGWGGGGVREEGRGVGIRVLVGRGLGGGEGRRARRGVRVGHDICFSSQAVLIVWHLNSVKMGNAAKYG
ncbi:uncharacterized protein MYCGRDRAFT_83120, partial [Zymoseptoria tritici IPO323]